MLKLLLPVLLLGGGATANLNARPYVIANGDASSENEFSTEYTSEYFDVYSPTIRSLYSQVQWTMQEPVLIPEEIIDRFSGGKVMAIVGYEADQVRQLEDGTEESVPITWAYNHHYQAWLLHRSERLDREIEENFQNHSYQWGAEEPYPQNAYFSEGNGGEFRSSYHGYPKGYAQLVESPTHFRFNPMQIDSWNRTHMKSATYHPGPLPKSSRIPHSAGYSGLIECPCSTRLPKEWSMSYSIDKCQGGDIANSTECMTAAKAVVASNHYNLVDNNDDDDDAGCSILQHENGAVDVHWNTATSAVDTRDDDAEKIVAVSNKIVNITVMLDETTATIKMSGPADRWFGVGFGSNSMCIHQISDECPEGGPYAIVVSGVDEVVHERKLDQHGPGHVLESSITVQSNQVIGGSRTITLTRPLVGISDEHFTFDTKTSLPIIAATGCGLEFAQHCGHGPSNLNFLAVNKKTPICRSGIKGTIGGGGFSNTRCADAPTSDLKIQGNPTCSIQTYQGGLSCCRHGELLLDKEQENPWPDQYLEYRMKWRFYFEEYEPAVQQIAPPSHQNLLRIYWQTEAFAGEYDIPQCSKSTKPEQCVHVITSRFKVRRSVSFPKGTDQNALEGVKIIYAGPHCHAPTCLSMELYNADTGELLCHVEPIHADSGKLYYERGFLAIPPCLFSETEGDGVAMAKLLSLDTTLLSIKRNNNTLPHTGEMASWQMRGVLVPKEQPSDTSSVAREVKASREDPALRGTDPIE